MAVAKIIQPGLYLNHIAACVKFLLFVGVPVIRALLVWGLYLEGQGS